MDEYGLSDERQEDDYASMLAALEQEIGRERVRIALAADERELDLIRIGHAPGDATAERLRLLRDVSRKADLADSGAVIEALMETHGRGGARPPTDIRSALSLLPHAKVALAAFVLVDLLVALALITFFALRAQ